MRTCVYVDGFNLYYGALKGTPHKWLNIKGKQIGIICPHKTIAEPLKSIPPSFVRHINAGDLRRSQFPAQMENGATKPDGWQSLPTFYVIAQADNFG